MTLRVVVADDVDDMRLMMRMVFDLDDRLAVVAEAANGLEAIDAARQHQPDAVLLDLMMPVMDGFTAVPAILRVAPGTRVVVYSGMTRDAAEPALEAGAVAFVEKGMSPWDIADVICRCCGVCSRR